MVATTEDQRIARRFLDVVPPLMHSLKATLDADAAPGASVTWGQMRCLFALGRGPCSVSDIAAHHDVAVPTVSRLVSHLVEKGLVARDTDPEDRRALVLSLTPAGQDVSREMAGQVTDHLAEVLTALSDDERHALDRGLTGLERALAARREQVTR